MRENYAQFKPKNLIAIIFFSLNLFTFSCKKDSQKIAKTPKDELIAKAKEFVLEKLPAENVSLTNALAMVNMHPDWSKAKTILNDKKQLVLGVPLQKTANVYSELNLIVIDGVSYSVIKNYSTNSDGQQNLKYYLPDGSLLIEGAYSVDTHKLKVFKTASAPVNLFGNRFTKSGSKMAMASASTGTSGPKDDPDGNGINLDDVTYTYTPPPPPPTPNTAEFPNNWDYGTGGTPEPTFPVDPIAGGGELSSDITDKIKNKCLDSVWTKVKANLDSKIASILNTTFGSSDKINFKIIDGNIDGGYPAKTEVETDKIINGEHIFDVKVTLNKNILPNASQEFIATTMVHEIMHAYFDSNKTFYTQQFEQHRSMAENYIEDLKNGVQTSYPNLINKEAYALILNGFGDIFKNDLTYWNSLLTKYGLDNQQIINIRDSHKNHSLGTKTSCAQ